MRIISICFFLLTFQFVAAQDLEVDWARNFGNIADHYGYEVLIDADENTYITGTFRETVDFGGVALTSSGTANFFIAKYDPSGDLLWAKTGGGTSTFYEGGYAMALDTNGDVYVAGNFTGTAYFDNQEFTTIDDGTDGFIAKYNGVTGDLIWINQIGGSQSDGGVQLVVKNENVYLLSRSESAYVIFDDSTVLSGDPAGALFICNYSLEGAVISAKKIANNIFFQFFGFEMDDAGNFYVAGTFTFEAIFGNTLIVSNGFRDAFLAKYDNSGSLIWVNQIGGSGDDYGSSLCLDDDGDIYFTGHFSETVNVWGTNITSKGETDVFVSKFDSNGNMIWVTSAGDSELDEAFDIATNSEEVFVVGRFQDSLIVADQVLESNGLIDIFMMRLDVDGSHLNAQGFGGAGTSYFEDRVWGVNYSNNTLAMTGNFQGTMNVDPLTLTSNGQADIFVIKWKCITPLNATITQNGNQLTANESNFSYQWLDCATNQMIPNETNQSFEATTSGNYAVQISDGTCQSTSVCQEVIVSSLQEIALEDAIHIFPNPNNGNFQIEVNNSVGEKMQFTIYNSIGQLINHQEFNSSTTYPMSVQNNNLLDGVYWLNISNGNESILKRIVVRK